MKSRYLAAFLSLFLGSTLFAQVPGQDSTVRRQTLLATAWRTQISDSAEQYRGFEQESFQDTAWKTVSVPHNWQGYSYDKQDVHGSRHGSAWYRTTFHVTRSKNLDRTFLVFEGVNSYATVWVNGQVVGKHAGGLTTFTLDITSAIRFDKPNLLAVRADNPSHIQDLPWAAGDDSDVLGFAEGSQPMGIFRPVHLVQTSALRIQPFGVNVWNGTDVSEKAAQLHVTAEVQNYGEQERTFELRTEIVDRQGKVVDTGRSTLHLKPQEHTMAKVEIPVLAMPHLWSLQDPYLYKAHTVLSENGHAVDDLTNDFGIRWISWPTDAKGEIQPGQFLLNGKPVFIRGIAEYEHLLGGSQAFTPEQVATRVHMVEASGFNAFRDGHYPHNLRYGRYWDGDGLLWWTQFSAHIFFDNPTFRANFKALLADWVKERRNSPSLMLWGLQNESVLPTDFAQECVELIRQLDPTTSTQRKVTTCNFGTGTDWNVPQNWSGTYGGVIERYAEELQKEVMVGEYGAWRSIGFHAEGAASSLGVAAPVGSTSTTAFTEDRMTAVLEQKVRLAESVSDRAAGQFAWVLVTHENPGRLMRADGTQIYDGIRDLDHVGPANNKGLFTLWGEPLDAFYMYRSNYVSGAKEPMVYIVSHTWPDRWADGEKNKDVIVYSNCDEVELFNDVDGSSLGVQKRNGIGTHFTWATPTLKYNVLYAVGRVAGKVVAKDRIILQGLPPAPHLEKATAVKDDLTAPAPHQRYLYRVHTGGSTYKDTHGNTWLADQDFDSKAGWGFTSWAGAYSGLDPELGSRGVSYDPVAGTADPDLFRSYRYGRDELSYRFRLPDGHYRVELYFAEPWFGRAGINAAGWRLFDVAIGGRTVLKDLDIWKEAGFEHALKKTVDAEAKDGLLEIDFPHVASNQAIVSAIAISTSEPKLAAVAQESSKELIQDLRGNAGAFSVQRYLDIGDVQYSDKPTVFTSIPPQLLDADWVRGPQASGASSFRVAKAADVYVLHENAVQTSSPWLKSWKDTGLTVRSEDPSSANHPQHLYRVYKQTVAALQDVQLGDTADTVLVKRSLTSPLATESARRAPTVYSVASAKITGGDATGHPLAGDDGKTATFHAASGSIDWKMYVGVSGSYRLTIRYATTAAERFGTVRILDNHGNDVDSAPIRLFNKTDAASQTITVTVTLNAGNYTLQLNLPNAEGLVIGSLTVQ